MSNFQEWCVKVLPFIQAAANGEVVQVKPVEGGGSDWFDLHHYPMSFPVTAFDFDNYDYRIKPRTIMIGDIEVPEPMRKPPIEEQEVYTVTPHIREGVSSTQWVGAGWQYTSFERGLMHESSGTAEIHAKALIALTAKKDASHE